MTTSRGERQVRRYRLMMLNKPIAPWRAKIEDAQADAIAAGVADWDHHHRALFVTVPAAIVIGIGPLVPARESSSFGQEKRPSTEQRLAKYAGGKQRLTRRMR